MKKTQRIDAYRNIKKSIVSFLSVTLVTMLGLWGLFTMRYMSAGIANTSEQYYISQNFKNYEMISATGVTQDNVEKIKNTKGISDAEGVIQSFGNVKKGNYKANATILSLTENVSVPLLVKGKLPKGNDECVIGEDFAEVSKLKIGDKIKVNLTRPGIDDPVYNNEFVIKGFVKHPDYIRRKSTNVVVLPLSAYNMEGYNNIYTNVFIRADKANDVQVFSRDYYDRYSNITKSLKSLTKELKKDSEKYITDRIESQKKEEAKLYASQNLVSNNQELIANQEMLINEGKMDASDYTCKWILTDRRANAAFTDINANIHGMNTAGNIFGILFMLVTAIVCFSTITIIIDDQKKLVGTVKAFGFSKKEVFNKYLIFAVSASIIGDVLGVILAYIFSEIIQKNYAKSGIYQIGVSKSVVTLATTVIICLLMIVVCIIATVIACLDIIKHPASALMQGANPSKRKKKNKVTKTKSNKSLYSRLIFRNMLDDKARVIISIVIIGFSCILIGTGFSLKLGYTAMIDKQLSDVSVYDIRADLSTDDANEKAQIEKVLKDFNVDYLPATYKVTRYIWEERTDVGFLLCADADKIGDYYKIVDYKTKKTIKVPKEGVLVQNKLQERRNMNDGEQIILLNDSFEETTTTIKGNFTNYLGRLLIMSPEAYKKAFGETNVENCYYINLNGANGKALRADLVKACPDISFENKEDFKTTYSYESISSLYNILVGFTVSISVIMSIMILTNLANIAISRKKNQLIVMRINGFTVKETKRYLSRETAVTTFIGVVTGVIIGILMNPTILANLEPDDLLFVRSTHVFAWVMAIVLEVTFAIIIYSLSFRKIKDLRLRDIS